MRLPRLSPLFINLIIIGLLFGNGLAALSSYIESRTITGTVHSLIPSPYAPGAYYMAADQLWRWMPATGAREPLPLPPTQVGPLQLFASSEAALVTSNRAVYQLDESDRYTHRLTLPRNERLIGVSDSAWFIQRLNKDRIELHQLNPDTFTYQELLNREQWEVGFFQQVVVAESYGFVITEREVLRAPLAHLTELQPVYTLDDAQGGSQAVLTSFATGHGTVLFLSTLNQGMVVSEDLGVTWHEAQSGLDNYFAPHLVHDTEGKLFSLLPSGAKAFSYSSNTQTWESVPLARPWGQLIHFRAEDL